MVECNNRRRIRRIKRRCNETLLLCWVGRDSWVEMHYDFVNELLLIYAMQFIFVAILSHTFSTVIIRDREIVAT